MFPDLKTLDECDVREAIFIPHKTCSRPIAGIVKLLIKPIVASLIFQVVCHLGTPLLFATYTQMSEVPFCKSFRYQLSDSYKTNSTVTIAFVAFLKH